MHVLSVIFQPPPTPTINQIYILQYTTLDWLNFQLTPMKKTFSFICGSQLEFRFVVCRQLFTTSPIQIGSSSCHSSEVTLSFSFSLVLKKRKPTLW